MDRVDLEVMAMTYSTFPRSPERKVHLQMQFGVILKKALLAENTVSILSTSLIEFMLHFVSFIFASDSISYRII